MKRAHLKHDVRLIGMGTARMEIGTMCKPRSLFGNAELHRPSRGDLGTRPLQRLLFQGRRIRRMFDARRLDQPSGTEKRFSPFSTGSVTSSSAVTSAFRPVQARMVAFALPSQSRRFWPDRINSNFA